MRPAPIKICLVDYRFFWRETDYPSNKELLRLQRESYYDRLRYEIVWLQYRDGREGYRPDIAWIENPPERGRYPKGAVDFDCYRRFVN